MVNNIELPEVQPSNVNEEREAMNHMAPQWRPVECVRLCMNDRQIKGKEHEHTILASLRLSRTHTHTHLDVSRDSEDAWTPFKVFETASTDLQKFVRRRCDD